MNDETYRPPGPGPADSGYVEPDPDEPPPLELWSAVGDVRPWGTLALLMSWALVFAWLAIRGEVGNGDALVAWGASVTGRGALDTSWRLLAATFLHAGAAHVFFNAISMWIFGQAVERIFARGGFWVVFALGGAAASLGSLAWRAYRHGSVMSLSVGASGAIFALGGAVLVAALRLRHRLAPGRARALGAAIMFLLAQALVSGLTRHGTDNVGHVTGLVAGIAVGAVTPLSTRLGDAGPGRLTRVFGAISVLALAGALAIGAWSGLSGR